MCKKINKIIFFNTQYYSKKKQTQEIYTLEQYFKYCKCIQKQLLFIFNGKIK